MIYNDMYILIFCLFYLIYLSVFLQQIKDLKNERQQLIEQEHILRKSHTTRIFDLEYVLKDFPSIHCLSIFFPPKEESLLIGNGN